MKKRPSLHIQNHGIHRDQIDNFLVSVGKTGNRQDNFLVNCV